jgi:hypothetical protein
MSDNHDKAVNSLNNPCMTAQQKLIAFLVVASAAIGTAFVFSQAYQKLADSKTQTTQSKP